MHKYSFAHIYIHKCVHIYTTMTIKYAEINP